MSIAQKGYVYVWVSNENCENRTVYFDDLKVSHTKSNILQEDHYYPFGMNMHGLSSSASLAKPNAYKFNSGTELTKDFGWQMYDTPFRSYDAQLGRFHQIDPLADNSASQTPYNFANNDPIFWNDPTGLAPDVSDIIRTLLDSKHGGNWSSNDGIRVYRTEEDSFWSGVIYRERFGMWDMNDDRFQDGGTNSRSTAFSIFYQDRAFNGRLFSYSEATLAFKFMVKMSFEETTNKKGKVIRNPIREVAAWLTDGGVLVQPWKGNLYDKNGALLFLNMKNAVTKTAQSHTIITYLSTLPQ